ncbi:MAG TPA: MFS transporter [Candidatus Megaira endosymbiont of Stentor roeselii]|nr:MFS transporter [Candidatus Megaera endosymbiont of Stentor roeselii]
MNSKTNTYKQNIKGWMVVACGGIFYMYQFMIRVSPNIMNNELLSNFALDAAGLGVLLGAYNWSYSAMQLPLGITIDRFGPRLFLCIAATLCGLSSFIFGNTTSPLIGGCARFLMGMGSACGLIGTIKLGTLWLEPKHVAKVTGLVILMGTAGAGLGGAPLEMILNEVGFKNTMEFLGFIGLIVSIIIYFFVSNYPPVDHHEELLDIYANNHPFTNILLLLKTPQAWILAIYGMLMYLPITVIGVAWGVSFIRTTYQVSDISAATIVSTMFFGAAIGSPFFAYFSDIAKNRRLPMFCGSFVTTIVWFIVIIFQVPYYLLYVLFFVGGFAYTAKCLSFASICETMPLKMSGVSIAFVNAIVMSTGTIFLPIIEVLIDYHNNGRTLLDVPCYNGEDYRFALVIVPISLLISFIIVFFMKETHPDHKIPKEYGSFATNDIV